MKLKVLLLILSLGTVGITAAQNAQVNRIDVRGNKVIVWYQLDDENPNHLYVIQLFSSRDNFTNPLSKVSGDVGPKIKPGIDKRITWDITNEIGNFKGNIVFEVRGKVFVPFVKLNQFNATQVYKSKKNYPISWESGNLSGQVNIELYRSEERIAGENNIPNVGNYNWTVPSAKKGDNYRLKFTNSEDKDDFQYTPYFTIKPRTSFLYKAGAVIVVGAGVAILVGKGGSNSDNSLPNPPSTPGGN